MGAPMAQADSSAFKTELAELIPHLRAFARSLCHNAAEADDLAQEALVKAWRARESYTPGTNLKAWVFMILRNHFYSERRKAWRKNEVSTEKDIERPGPATAAQDASVQLEEVRQALDSLSEEQREALILVGAGGFSYEEAAEICDCAVGTIKSRVSRERANLLELLERKQLKNKTPHTSSVIDTLMQEAATRAGEREPK